MTDAEKAVAAAVDRLTAAMLSGRAADLDAVAADNLIYIHSNGKAENKPEFIESFVSGSTVFETIELSGQQIKITGDTAIVWHTLEGKTKNSGVPGRVKIGIMLVWQKQDGEWKLLGRQAFKF